MSARPSGTCRPAAADLGLVVVSVADLADDLLQQILQCHQAGRAAVLVQHDRQVLTAGAEAAEQAADAAGPATNSVSRISAARSGRGRPDDASRQDVLEVDDADDVIQVALVDRQFGHGCAVTVSDQCLRAARRLAGRPSRCAAP